MKKIILLILVFPFFLNGLEYKNSNSLIQNEIATLEEIIQATKLALEKQTKLLELIKKYQLTQDRYLLGEEHNELLYAMAKLAEHILNVIKENQMTLLFDPNFLGELTLISKPVAKTGIPKP